MAKFMQKDIGRTLLEGLSDITEKMTVVSDLAIMDAARHADICYKLRTETFPSGNMLKDRLTLDLLRPYSDAKKEISVGELDLHRFKIENGATRIVKGEIFHAHLDHLLEIYNEIFDWIFPYESKSKTVSIHGFGKYFDSFDGVVVSGREIPRMESYHTHLREAELLKDLTRKL